MQYARPFHQNLGSPLIYFFDVHTTICPKYMVLFHLCFLLCTTIRPRLRILTDLFLLFAHDHMTEVYGPLAFILSFVYDHITKIKVLIDLFFLFVHDHSAKLYGPLPFIFFSDVTIRPLRSSSIDLFCLYTTVRPKFRVLINLFF